MDIPIIIHADSAVVSRNDDGVVTVVPLRQVPYVASLKELEQRRTVVGRKGR